MYVCIYIYIYIYTPSVLTEHEISHSRKCTPAPRSVKSERGESMAVGMLTSMVVFFAGDLFSNVIKHWEGARNSKNMLAV